MLELRNINKTYKPKKGVPVKALKNISISFQEKGMVFILGKSGCGKSTLLNVIGGLDKFDSGEIIIKGKSSKEFSGSDFDSYRNTFLGFIFQEYNILTEFNVEKNIALALELQGKKATREKVNELLQKVDLADQGKRKTNELSGGQKQRIAIARALIKDPEIIIADEPTGALDSATGKQVFDTLKKLSADKLVIIVSHDREFAEIYADRIIEMKDGVIISDETKRKIDGVKLNADVSVVGNDILHIKGGHALTQKELEAIGKFISKQKVDTIISVGEKNNQKFKEIAKIDNEGRSERFDDTKIEDLKLKEYDKKQLKLIRSRLKWKDSFKMGASGLKAKPVRLFFSILLAFIAFAMFGLVDTFGSFKYVTATTQSIIDSGVKSLVFKRKENCREDADYVWFDDTLMSTENIETINTQLNTNLKPVYELGYPGLSGFIYTQKNDYYHTLELAGIVEFSESDFQNLGYSLSAGRYPTAVDEIVITDYIYENFAQGGYRNYDSSIIIKAEDLTKEIFVSQAQVVINSTTLKIVGILDTKMEKDRYKIFWDEQASQNASFLDEQLKIKELQQLQQYSYHNMVFGFSGIIQTLKINNSKIGTDISGSYSNRYCLTKNKSTNGYSLNLIATVEQLEQNPTNFALALASGESIGNKDGVENVAIDFSLATGSFNDLGWKNINVPSLGYVNMRNIDNNDELSIAVYICDKLFSNTFTQQQKTDAVTTVINYLNETYEPEFSSYFKYKQTDDLSIKIVGLFKSSDVSNSISYLIVGEDFYQDICKKAQVDLIYSFAIATMPSDFDSVKKLVEYHYKNLKISEADSNPESSVVYLMPNEVTSTMDDAYGLIAKISVVCLYVGLGLCAFAALLLMNFISTSISYKKREIGILRALGSRKSDVFGIFFNESLIIAFINFVLATATTIAVTIILNGVFRNNYGLKITLLNLGVRQIVLLLGVSVLVAFLSSFLPVMKIARKQPIDAINNR